MAIKFLDLDAAHRAIRSQIDDAIARVVSSGQFILGPESESFEAEFAAYCEAEYCVGVGNGLDALHLILRALEIGPGDEVIVSSNTFIATWLAVSMVGATPVPVEPDPVTHNLDPGRTAAAITPRTRAIMPTHLYGQPADLDSFLSLAREHGLKLVEDAAQAHGARYKGKRIGAHGDAVAWSFYPSKNLGALGDGGAVTTNNAALAERVRMLCNYGSREKYVNDVQGYNSRLDPLQAGVLRAKLKHLDSWNAHRSAVAGRYLDQLGGSGLTLPIKPDWAEVAWHLFVVRSGTRDAVASHLAKKGIETLVHYPVPPHLQKAYASLGFKRGALPISEQLADEVLSLPMGPHLSEADVAEVIGALRNLSTAH